MSGPTSSKGTRILGAAALAGIAALLLFGLVLSPDDVAQGDSVRLFYVHVPTAIVALLSFGVTAAASAVYLRRRTEWWDLVAGASAEIGVVFTGATLVAGMMWGRPTWGVYWTWDARLTSTALLFLLFCGYLAIRRIPAAPDVRGRRAAWAALIAFVDVPIVHWSVSWWRSLHQGPTITRLDPTIDGLMLFTAMIGIVTALAVYVWLMIHRFRVGYLENRVEAIELDAAIAERHAEAEGQGAPIAAEPEPAPAPQPEPVS
jgi:heme exporter protein C